MPGANNFCDGLEQQMGPWKTTLKIKMEDNKDFQKISDRMKALRLKTHQTVNTHKPSEDQTSLSTI